MRLEEIFPTPIWIFDNMNLDVDSIKFWAYEEKKKDEGRIISNVGLSLIHISEPTRPY